MRLPASTRAKPTSTIRSPNERSPVCNMGRCTGDFLRWDDHEFDTSLVLRFKNGRLVVTPALSRQCQTPSRSSNPEPPVAPAATGSHLILSAFSVLQKMASAPQRKAARMERASKKVDGGRLFGRSAREMRTPTPAPELRPTFCRPHGGALVIRKAIGLFPPPADGGPTHALSFLDQRTTTALRRTTTGRRTTAAPRRTTT
jgi:hypothetical protein